MPRRGRHTRPVHLPDLVLDWYRANARDLPWRRPGTTPWGVLVSEFMLQQTPVARVEPVWREWMARWPARRRWPAASRADVLRAWGKLGYPRRALRLHEAAAVIAERHGDVVPPDVEALRGAARGRLYTARAVAAFGYGRRARWSTRTSAGCVARAVHGRATPARPADLGRPRRRRRPAARPTTRRRAWLGRADGAGRGGVHGPRAALRRAARYATGVRVGAAGPAGVHRAAAGGAGLRRHRPAGPRPAARRAAGRAGPVERAALDAAWSDAGPARPLPRLPARRRARRAARRRPFALPA